MTIAIIEYGLLFAIFSLSLNGIATQFLTKVIGIQEIIAHLENQTDACDTIHRIASRLNQSADTQTRMEDTLDRIANNQIESGNVQTRMDETLTQIATTQTRMAVTQTQMATTLTQIANTQSQMADALTQIVNLLQMKGQHLQTPESVTSEMTDNRDGQHSTHNPLTSVKPTTGIPRRDCSDITSSGGVNSSGTYTLQLEDDLDPIRVYCDGGWTVFQNRFDGSVDFYLDWDAYEHGFGSPDAEHWMGLKDLHRLTRQGSWNLRIDLEDFSGNTAYAEYDLFSVGDAASLYRLSIGSYNGTAGDALRDHNNQPFSTKDADHDAYVRNCAQGWRGAWWYTSCAYSNLNGLYLGESQVSYKGMTWLAWKTSYEVLKRTQMKIRRVR